MWPIIRSTPDARPGQPQTKKRKCGIQPAHQSLFTDVFGLRLLLCTIHQCKNFTMSPRGDGKPWPAYLTGDIRMGWSGRAPAPPAIEAGKGRQDKEHAVSQTLNATIAVVGIDIGKNSFHIVGHDGRGAIVCVRQYLPIGDM
jgi:hypothetical protein